MEAAGFAMVGAAAALILATGLPAFAALIGVAVVFASLGLAAGGLSYNLLTALPSRLTGLMENDLVQALPLYVFMGSLLNRLDLAEVLFRCGRAVFGRSAAGAELSAMMLGAVLAPMNGSVGASVASLSRIVGPRLDAEGIPPPRGIAAICVASTFGVVVPPSLILILLSDTMIRAQSEAIARTGSHERVINTQDLFHGALLPAALFLGLSLLIAWAGGRSGPATPRTRLPWRDWAAAGATLGFILALLASVVAGYVYAVEAAAAGAAAMLLGGLLSGRLGLAALRLVLRETMAVSGALFALLVAAASFTLVFRAFGSDELLTRIIAGLPGATYGPLIAVLAVVGVAGLVLDAFEIIFVVLPLAMPPLLVHVTDAVWVSVLALLALQASFLIPPFGYAVMMARGSVAAPAGLGALSRRLAPYLAAQLLVLGATLLFPALVHWGTESAGGGARLTEEQVQQELNDAAPVIDPVTDDNDP